MQENNQPTKPDAASDPYYWRLPTRAAIRYTEQALQLIQVRLDNLFPTAMNLEEIAYAKKARDALQKAYKELQPIRNI